MKRIIVWLLCVSALALPAWGQGQAVDSDVKLTAQLREAFRQVDGLQGVTLEVRGGVAVLRGEVPSLEASMKAEDLAKKLDGILAVDNGLTVNTQLAQRISPVLSKLYLKARNFMAYLPLFAVALVVFLLSVWVGKLLTRWNWGFSRLSKNVFIQDLLKQMVYAVVLMTGALIAMEILDATALVGAVLGTAGVLGVALGFAFQDLAENSLASALLSLRQPFSPNDYVVIDGHEGKVVRLTSRATILLTLDGNHLRIPNATVFKAVILNYTRNPERRFSFNVGIDTDEDLTRAQRLALKTLDQSPGVMKDPPPQCLIEELGDSNVQVKILGWVDQTENDFVKVRSEAIRKVKEAFDAADVFMPEPIYKVRLEQTEPRESEKKASPLEDDAPVTDLAPETHLDDRIEEERQVEGKDLLSESTRQE